MGAPLMIIDRSDGAEPLPGRAEALAEIDSHLENLKNCVHYLVEQNITVISVDMRRRKSRPQISVAPTPRLHILFGDDCANIGRRNDGALTIYPWIATRFGCDIRWEETCEL